MDVLGYAVVIHKAEEGGYWMEVPSLEGCLTQGETVEEVLDNAQEAISLHIESLRELNQPIPPDDVLLLGRVQVTV